MLLQQIVEELDTELDRLQQLRTILSGIQTVVSDAISSSEEVAAAEPARTSPSPNKETIVENERAEVVARQRQPRAPKRRNTAAAAGALQGSIPPGPVLVQASALAKENEARQGHERPKRVKAIEPPGSLGSMIRALRLDRLS